MLKTGPEANSNPFPALAPREEVVGKLLEKVTGSTLRMKTYDLGIALNAITYVDPQAQRHLFEILSGKDALTLNEITSAPEFANIRKDRPAVAEKLALLFTNAAANSINTEETYDRMDVALISQTVVQEIHKRIRQMR